MFTVKLFPFKENLLHVENLADITNHAYNEAKLSMHLRYKRVLLYMLVNQGFQCKVIHYKANKINVLFLRHCCIRPNATTLINFC